MTGCQLVISMSCDLYSTRTSKGESMAQVCCMLVQLSCNAQALAAVRLLTVQMQSTCLCYLVTQVVCIG